MAYPLYEGRAERPALATEVFCRGFLRSAPHPAIDRSDERLAVLGTGQPLKPEAGVKRLPHGIQQELRVRQSWATPKSSHASKRGEVDGSSGSRYAERRGERPRTGRRVLATLVDVVALGFVLFSGGEVV